MIYSRLLYVAAIASMCVASSLSAQGYCRTAAPHGAAMALKDYVTVLATSNDAVDVATRLEYGLPQVAASEIALVSDTALCRLAAEAYHRVAIHSNTGGIAPVHVIQYGSTRFVVLDPDTKRGEFALSVVFDSLWQWIASFFG